MGKNYNHEIGYESLLTDFKRYQQQSPRGVSMRRNGNNIYLKFKIGETPRKDYGCNCSFTLDGMVSALSKAHKVSDALKRFTSESEFWEWYDKEIKEVGKIENDLLTFKDAIAVVEDDFWRRKDRRGNKRIKGHPSHENSWNRTYLEYYKHLPLDKPVTKTNILNTLNRWEQGTKSFKDAMSAYRGLVRKNGYDSIYKELKKIDSKQTEFRDCQTITLEEFMEWRDKTLGITEKLPYRAKLEVRKAWLWVFGMQIIYGLRINEVFAIKNLDKPAYDPKTNKLIVHAYNDLKNNPHRLIYIGNETNIGTTVKTGQRIARPMIPPKYPNLYTDWELGKPSLPDIKPKSSSTPETITGFHHRSARVRLERWNAPFTQTHADRHLGNLLGVQAGIPVEIRAQSMGHSVTMNESTYKKRQGIQTQIDISTIFHLDPM
ncbi:MAG: hypothetical protein QNJ32_29870 [Xenococcaceae cyanobacterium MO_167.B27]|nr:hypothetical protein [Xenococcaceae cyanobacterium MO_167.B27]